MVPESSGTARGYAADDDAIFPGDPLSLTQDHSNCLSSLILLRKLTATPPEPRYPRPFPLAGGLINGIAMHSAPAAPSRAPSNTIEPHRAPPCSPSLQGVHIEEILHLEIVPKSGERESVSPLASSNAPWARCGGAPPAWCRLDAQAALPSVPPRAGLPLPRPRQG